MRDIKSWFSEIETEEDRPLFLGEQGFTFPDYLKSEPKSSRFSMALNIASHFDHIIFHIWKNLGPMCLNGICCTMEVADCHRFYSVLTIEAFFIVNAMLIGTMLTFN